jgi:hypothetical protein
MFNWQNCQPVAARRLGCLAGRGIRGLLMILAAFAWAARSFRAGKPNSVRS